MAFTTITERGIQTRYQWTLQHMQLESWVGDLSVDFGSDQETEKYPFLGTAPAMREWLAGRRAATPSEYEFSITNKKFEASEEIPCDYIRRAMGTHVDAFIQGLARRNVTHWGKLLADLVIAGESTACYDKQFFFDTDHPNQLGGTQSNDISSATPVGTATAPSSTDFSDAINNGIEQLIGITDDQGEPMNEGCTDFMVLVPTGFRTVAGTAIGNELLSNGTNVISNPISSYSGFNIRLATTTRLSSWTTKFAMFCLDTPTTRPFIRQEESNMGHGLKVQGAGSDFEFENDKWKMGTQASRNVGYGAWESACLVTLT